MRHPFPSRDGDAGTLAIRAGEPYMCATGGYYNPITWSVVVECSGNERFAEINVRSCFF